MNEYTLINPEEIPQGNEVYMVLVDDRRGFLGWFIKAHESGNYNHAMLMIDKGMFVSQANVLKLIKVERYMKPGIFLKFWKVEGLSESDIDIIRKEVKKSLGRWYDLVGLVGQALPFLHWIQIPGLFFCSEAITNFFRKTGKFKWLPLESSPPDLDNLSKKHPDQFSVAGYWFSD